MRRWGPVLMVLLLGIPTTFVFASATMEGERRRVEVPLRAILGDGPFEQLSRGEATPEHYLGSRFRMPSFELPDRSGRVFRSRDLRGKTLVINMWTVTCGPCLQEMPSLIEMARVAHFRQDVEVVAISTDSSVELTYPFVPRESPLRVLMDPNRSVVSDQFGTTQYPETWVIDSRGIIRLRVDGARDWSSPVVWDVLDLFR